MDSTNKKTTYKFDFNLVVLIIELKYLTNKMKCLELFSGTHSVGKCCKELGIDVLSIDIDGAADINISILDWDYKSFPKDEFDIIWASPPCSTFSHIQYSWIGRKRNGVIFTKEQMENDMITKGDPLIKKTLEIIEYFNPTLWFIENPDSGRMKNRPFMKDLPYYVVDYCMYSDWGYRKRTRIWTNKENWTPMTCDNKGTCGNMIEGLHKTNLANTARRRKADKMCLEVGICNNSSLNLEMRYRIPPDLIYSLLMDSDELI